MPAVNMPAAPAGLLVAFGFAFADDVADCALRGFEGFVFEAFILVALAAFDEVFTGGLADFFVAGFAAAVAFLACVLAFGTAAFAGAAAEDFARDFLRDFLDIRLPFVAFGGSLSRIV